MYSLCRQSETDIAEYTYDALGRRIEKKDCVTSANTRRYYYGDKWQVLAEYDTGYNLEQSYVYGNYIDEVLILRNSGGTNYYHAHDHLHSPVVLMNTSGNVIERYEYDAYGRVKIWDASLTTERDTSSYDNPYYFTGRRMDELDNGDLKLMYYRNRYYDTETGRFLQHDPIGITPNPELPNVFEVIRQYSDGANLYEYVNSNPVGNADTYGLWGRMIHYARTRAWAHEKQFGHLMMNWAAEGLAYYDNWVDTWRSPLSFDDENLSWHFDLPHDATLTWGPSDSRHEHSEAQYELAISWCDLAVGADRTSKIQYASLAVQRLGVGLHPLQDWVAHGTWIPKITWYHRWPGHPGGSDDPALDFAHSGDGILRDWEDLGGEPNEPYFNIGTTRYSLTREKTLEYLNRFRDECSNPCKCLIYAVNGQL